LPLLTIDRSRVLRLQTGLACRFGRHSFAAFATLLLPSSSHHSSELQQYRLALMLLTLSSFPLVSLIAYPEIVQSTFEAPILQNPAYSSLSSFHSLSLSTALLSLINPILITRLFLNTLETNAPSEAVLTLSFIPLFHSSSSLSLSLSMNSFTASGGSFPEEYIPTNPSIGNIYRRYTILWFAIALFDTVSSLCFSFGAGSLT